MANETVLFKRGDSATITSTPVTDGQILFDTSGNGKMYLDNGTDRLEMGGAITVDASLSKTSTNAIQNKAVTGNILNSLAEVSAATQQNTIAGALALKEVNSSLVSNIYVGEDGKLHKVQGGADSVLPFSGGKIEFSAFNTYVLPNTFPWNFNVEGINSIEINFISSTESSSLSVIKMDHLYKPGTTAPDENNKIAHVTNGNKINVDVSQCDYISLRFSATDGGGAAYIYFTIVSG